MLGLSLGLPIGAQQAGGGADPEASIAALLTGRAGTFLPVGSPRMLLFQERTGADATTPAALGDPVGTFIDQTKGLIFTAPTDAARAVYMLDETGRPVLRADGVNNGYESTTNLDLSGSNKVFVAAAARENGLGAFNRLVELSRNVASENGTFLMGGRVSGGPEGSFRFSARGSSTICTVATGGLAIGSRRVIEGVADIGAPIVRIAVDGGAFTDDTESMGTGNFTSDRLNLFARLNGTGNFMQADLSALFIRGGEISTEERAAVRQYLAGKFGVTLA